MIELKLGSRIFLNNEYLEKITQRHEKSSRSFAIVAVTDCATVLKNLRSGEVYTLPTTDVVKNAEAPQLEKASPKEIVVVELPAPKPKHLPSFDVIASGSLQIKTTISSTSVIKSKEEDIFGYLYGEEN